MKYALFIISLLIVGLSVSAAALPVPHVCGPGVNFIGEVIFDFTHGEVKLDWTVLEDATVRGYLLSRYEAGCGQPKNCSVPVAWVSATTATASLPAMKSYSLVDTAPPGLWIYRLEVVRVASGSCARETSPLLISPTPPCGLADVCRQVEQTFVGTVILSGISVGSANIQWMTSAEDGAAKAYRLTRSSCAQAATCTSSVALVSATGTCGQVVLHRVTDSPPSGQWTYRVEVLDENGRAACAATASVAVP